MKTLSVVVGSYEKDGKTKKKYFTIGKIVDTKNGQSIILEDVVCNYLKGLFGQNYDGRVNIYDNEDKPTPARSNDVPRDDNDLPF